MHVIARMLKYAGMLFGLFASVLVLAKFFKIDTIDWFVGRDVSRVQPELLNSESADERKAAALRIGASGMEVDDDIVARIGRMAIQERAKLPCDAESRPDDEGYHYAACVALADIGTRSSLRMLAEAVERDDRFGIYGSIYILGATGSYDADAARALRRRAVDPPDGTVALLADAALRKLKARYYWNLVVLVLAISNAIMIPIVIVLWRKLRARKEKDAM